MIRLSVSHLLPMEQQPCKVLLIGLSKNQKVSLDCVLNHGMIHQELILRHYFKKTPSIQVRRLLLMRSKNCEFYLLILKEACSPLQMRSSTWAVRL